MQERQVFRVIVRAIAVIVIVVGVSDLFGGVLTLSGWRLSPYYSATNQIGAGAAYLVTGLLVTLASPLIVALFYGHSED
jgi:hypothetical protein